MLSIEVFQSPFPGQLFQMTTFCFGVFIVNQSMDWIPLSGLSNLAGRRSPFKGLKLLRASGCQLAEFLSVYSGKCKTNRLPEIQKWLFYCFFTAQIVLHCFSAAALNFCSKNFFLQLTSPLHIQNIFFLFYYPLTTKCLQKISPSTLIFHFSLFLQFNKQT